MKKIEFTKSKPVYSARLLRFCLTLRYTFLPAYKLLQNEFNLPFVSFLRKLSSGKIDTLASAQILKKAGKISEDIILMFDEIYLKKCEEFSGAECTGSDENGELYKGLVCFMIVGLKTSVSFVVKSVPETKITGEWLKQNIEDCIHQLHESNFKVRAVVCDNHTSNVSAFAKLTEKYQESPEDLYITFEGQKLYLMYDTVHLMKNVRNNLLNRKRFLFPEFSFDKFRDEIKLEGGEVSWHLLHQVIINSINILYYFI